jgi:NAD(P)-dependent dehydrogenase (short-subunit alcohol dehydrogenase family)
MVTFVPKSMNVELNLHCCYHSVFIRPLCNYFDADVMVMIFFTGLWGLVNIARASLFGDIELTTVDQFSNVVNVTQLGMVRVTKAFLPAIRRRKGLSLLDVSTFALLFSWETFIVVKST